MTESVTSLIKLQYDPAPPLARADLERKLTAILLANSVRRGILSDDQFADAIGYSPSQARRLCMAVLGETAYSFCARVRLEHAAGRLAAESCSVGMLMPDTGFTARESFTRAFAEHFGCSPREFKVWNAGRDLRLPGYVLGRGLPWSASVQVRSKAGQSLTFMFDGPIFLGRVLPSGVIDWRSRF